jgi:hypothetical protein
MIPLRKSPIRKPNEGVPQDPGEDLEFVRKLKAEGLVVIDAEASYGDRGFI